MEVSCEPKGPRRCGSYRPGHEHHPIQARLAREDKASQLAEGRLVVAAPDGTLTVEVGGKSHRLWNHAPKRLRRLTARNDDVVTIQ
jgi:hypothetical protein